MSLFQGDRWFESISLQRGVRREPDFIVLGCRHSDSTIDLAADQLGLDPVAL
jgi:hypothetical protein